VSATYIDFKRDWFIGNRPQPRFVMSPADLNSQRHLWGSGTNRHPRPSRRHSGRRHFRPAFEQLESRRLLSTQSTANPNLVLYHLAGCSVPLASPAPPDGTLTPSQIRHAHGFDQTTFSNGAVQGDGSGQTIAIIDAYDNPNILGDLQQFDSFFGLPAPRASRRSAKPEAQPRFAEPIRQEQETIPGSWKPRWSARE
jgi:hypothetical protein